MVYVPKNVIKEIERIKKEKGVRRTSEAFDILVDNSKKACDIKPRRGFLFDKI